MQTHTIHVIQYCYDSCNVVSSILMYVHIILYMYEYTHILYMYKYVRNSVLFIWFLKLTLKPFEDYFEWKKLHFSCKYTSNCLQALQYNTTHTHTHIHTRTILLCVYHIIWYFIVSFLCLFFIFLFLFSYCYILTYIHSVSGIKIKSKWINWTQQSERE